MKKYLFVLIVLIIAFLGYRYVYHGHRDINKEDVSFEVNLKTLNEEYAKSNADANLKYLDKTIEFSGKVTHLEGNIVVVDDRISCVFQKEENLVKGQDLKVKGRFIGYDELLEEYNVDQCSIVK